MAGSHEKPNQKSQTWPRQRLRRWAGVKVGAQALRVAEQALAQHQVRLVLAQQPGDACAVRCSALGFSYPVSFMGIKQGGTGQSDASLHVCLACMSKSCST